MPPPPQPPQPGPQYETRTPEQHFEELVTQLNIPRQLAQAIREQESFRTPPSFTDPRLKTAAGARGWFQVLPETAAGYGLDTNDPFQNIEAGLRYIKEGLEKNNYDPDRAALYYHGGPDEKNWGPITRQYGTAVGKRMRTLLAGGDGGQGTGATVTTFMPGRPDPSTYVPTKAELDARTAAPRPAQNTMAPPGPPWYHPRQLLQTASDISEGIFKDTLQTGVNIARIAVPSAFEGADEVLAPSNRTQRVGQIGGQIGNAIIPSAAASRTATYLAGRVAPRLAPYVGRTIANVVPRVAVEAPAAAGIAYVQGGDPELAAAITAGIPAVGAAGRLLFASDLSPQLQRAIDWGRRNGIPIDLAAATSNQWARRLQAVVENTPGGAAIRAMVEHRRARRLTEVGNELADRVHPQPVTGEGAAQGVSDALDQRVAALHGRTRGHYRDAEAIQADPSHTRQVPTGREVFMTRQPIMEAMQLPVDTTNVRRALRPVLDQLLRQPLARQQASPALPALQALFGGGRFRSLMDLEADLGKLKSLADASGGLRDRSQGLAARAVAVLQSEIDDAARQADPALYEALRRGRRASAVEHAADRVRTKFAGSRAQQQKTPFEPLRAFKEAVQPGDVNIRRLLRLRQQVGPGQMRRMGRAFLQDQLEFATASGGFQHGAKIAQNWEKLGPRTKRLFYAPEHIAALDNFFRLTRRLAEDPNPSKSALVATVGLGGAGAVWKGAVDPATAAAALVGTTLVTALMHHPTGVRLLTQGLAIPAGTPAAAQWLRQAQELAGAVDSRDEDIVLPPNSPAEAEAPDFGGGNPGGDPRSPRVNTRPIRP